jgi:hypothetical protein
MEGIDFLLLGDNADAKEPGAKSTVLGGDRRDDMDENQPGIKTVGETHAVFRCRDGALRKIDGNEDGLEGEHGCLRPYG